MRAMSKTMTCRAEEAVRCSKIKKYKTENKQKNKKEHGVKKNDRTENKFGRTV